MSGDVRSVSRDKHTGFTPLHFSDLGNLLVYFDKRFSAQCNKSSFSAETPPQSKAQLLLLLYRGVSIFFD